MKPLPSSNSNLINKRKIKENPWQLPLRVETPQAVKLSLSYKVIWGIAALGTSLMSGVYAALLPIFYQDYLGLSANWIALASLIYAIWNAINDPLFGYITDSTRSKRGRRIPYMRYTAPFLALTFVLVWFAPVKAGQQGIFWWMLVTMLLYDTCYTIIGLVYSALLPEVSESDSERNGLQISSSLFGLLGTLLGFLIPDFFRPKAGTSPSFLPLQMAMIALAVVAMLLIMATTYKVKERPEFHLVDKPLKLIDALKYTFTSKAFLWLVSANFMSILISSIVTGSLFYVADYVLQVPTITLLACLFIPLIIGVPVTNLIRQEIWSGRRAAAAVNHCWDRVVAYYDCPYQSDLCMCSPGRFWSVWSSNVDECSLCSGSG